MKKLSNGIFLFENQFLRSEEVIQMAELSGKWRSGTVNGAKNEESRITDIHDLDMESELHEELLTTFIAGINQYGNNYKALKVTSGEQLRVARYPEGGHYKAHIDSTGTTRVISAVLFLNDDFEGGELVFPDYGITVNPKEGSLVLFPSNFMFIHKVNPVSNGTRYSVLSWFK